ncbi:hypothetical protein [Actinomadura terrae]|uniref:hypothetical protein n=1 Tax=Actinomadura terrae TaxID=604353 RepID=UPI001FA6EEE0|nr:hypothetical protein [Actinomadura terrae]
MQNTTVFNGKTKPFRQSMLGAVGVFLVALALVIVGTFAGFGKGVGLILVIVLLAALAAAGTMMPSLTHPLVLRIGDDGMEVSMRGKTTLIRWEQLEAVRIMPPFEHSKHSWLVASPRQAPMQLPRRMYHPEWNADLSVVKVCDLDMLDADVETIRAAVRQAAGPLWRE